MIRFFNPALSYQKHRTEFDSEIQRVLLAGDLILREDVERFEENLAKFVGTKYAVALNSGTDALYLALKVLGIGKGDEVIVPSHTFVSTIQVIVQAGATPVLMDMDEKFEITTKTKAIMPVHIAGELQKLNIPNNYEDLYVIEDACQALGAVKNPTSNVQCWSFYPAKILGAFGDAGALTTNNENIHNEIKELRNHCKKDYSKWGINSRMDNLQAAVLNIKMKYLPEVLVRRKEIAEIYLKKLEGMVGLPNKQEGRVWQDFIIQTEKRNELYDFLKWQGVETMKNEYPFPIPKLPQSLKYEAETLRIPCNENLTNEEVLNVIEKIKEFYDM